MADLNFDELSSLERIKHENKMKEIAFQAREDRKSEELKHENAKSLEWRKIAGAIGKGLVMAGAWFGLTCLADRIDVPRRNVPREK